MLDLVNCPNCDAIYVRNKFRDVCDACYKEEERQFDIVYQFLRQRENRAATIPQVIEETQVDEELLLKFIKTGRLKLASFPNLGYACEKCGTVIRSGKLCADCAEELRGELESVKKEEKRKKELRDRDKRSTYYFK
nr:TIGR03826 family flagellar region protein [uncultured Bacillus sp.]